MRLVLREFSNESRSALYYSCESSVSLKYVNVFNKRKKGQKTGPCELVNFLGIFIKSSLARYTFETISHCDSGFPKSNNEKSSLFKGDDNWALATQCSRASVSVFPFLHCLIPFSSD